MNANGTTRASTSRSQLASSDSGSRQRSTPSQFSKGAIVSLEMENFLSYPKAKVEFGPRLNVVIGPNGSGKSTLVCAIALGLGGSPKVLGRADHLQSFVTHGVNKDAKITTELFNPEGENMKIRRTFSRKSNSSMWHLNGRSIPEKQVKERINELGIQVENLCTFLPQDKVGDFSRFTADKLLLETEKALSLESLYSSHLKLIELQESAGRKVDEEMTTTEKLESMKLEQASLEKDVERMKERQHKQEQLEMHKKKKLWVKAQMTADLGKDIKAKRKAAEETLAIAAAGDQPLVDEVNRCEKEVAKTRGAAQEFVVAQKKHTEKAESASQQAEEYHGQTHIQKAALKNLETTRRNKESTLEKLKDALQAKVEDLARLKERQSTGETMEELNAKISQATTKLDDAKMDRLGQHNLYKEAQADISSIDQRIRELTNQHNQREIAFLNRHRQSAEMALKARKWADENVDKLQRKVWGPIALEVTVDDAEAAAALEHQVQAHTWCALVVESKQDHDTILRAMSSDRRPLTININEGGGLRNDERQVYSDARVTMFRETAGVRGFLDDFCKCSDTVRQSLRANSGIRYTLLGTAATETRIQKDTDFLKLATLVYAGGSHGTNGRGHALPFQQYSTTISQYGQRLASTRVTEVRRAMMLMGGVDEDAVRELEVKKEACIKSMNAAASKRDKIQEEVNQLSDVKEKLGVNYQNLVKAKQRETGLQSVIKKAEDKIERLEEDLSRDADDEKAGVRNRMENALKLHAKALKEGQQHLDTLLEMSIRWMGATMAKTIASDDLSIAKRALHTAEIARHSLRREVDDLRRSEEDIRAQFRHHIHTARMQAAKVIPSSQEDTPFGKVCDSLPDNMEGLDAVIEDLAEDLANTVDNEKVVQKFDKLKREVEEVERQLEELKRNNAFSEAVMQSIRDPWLGKLEATVEKLNTLFSEYMADNGHGGEVRLAMDESYKKWGLEIRVRFRNDESTKLETLSGQSHSGGERSVSTIMFLMALQDGAPIIMQDLQHSPFRAVDEINQGMDPGNERLVFSRIVRNSCGPDRRQYFLITPKLLQGLVAMDNDDVTIVIIMNGVNCVMGTDALRMSKFIAAKKRQLGQAGGQGKGFRKIPRLATTESEAD